LDDVRAVIIAARGVPLSNFLSSLLTDAIVLHCDERYQPCGCPSSALRAPSPVPTGEGQTLRAKEAQFVAPTGCFKAWMKLIMAGDRVRLCR
jgi:hypothetical protein